MEEKNMKREKDIFDKIMHLPILNILEPIYVKNKEILLYLFFGGCTSVISIVVYGILNITFDINELIANFISWIIAVLFAFFTNRRWVFETDNGQNIWKQLLSFTSGRVVTLIVGEVIIFIFVSCMEFPSLLIAFLAQVVVIVLNYIFSKWITFKK